MNDQTDAELLRAYAEHRSETAFAELVRRHLDFTYSAALRMVRDSHLAEDVTQAVFIALSRAAAELAQRPVLSGWLHRTARNIAAQTVRTIERRRAREQQAAIMNELLASDAEPSWQSIAPHLDAALDELNEADREALLQRYFYKKPAEEMARALGISAEAAQKRVTRAVERLRLVLSKKSVTIGAGGLVGLISVNAVQSAPAALAGNISAAALAGSGIATSAFVAAKTIAMTTLQKTLITITIAALAGTGIYEAHQTAKLRSQNQDLQAQMAPLTDQVGRLRQERDQATNQLADLAAENSRLKSQSNHAEIVKLRGQAGQAQTALQELAKARAAQKSTGAMSDYLTNAMAQGMKMAQKFQEKEIRAKVTRMQEKLRLTDDQARSIQAVMLDNIQKRMDHSLQDMADGNFMKGISTARTPFDEEGQIKALLTPDQLAAYPDYLHTEAEVAAQNSANSELSLLSREIDLTQNQQDKIRSILYQFQLDQPATAQAKATAQTQASGNITELIKQQVEVQKQELSDKVKLLQDVLTPDQLAVYQQKQTDMIDMQSAALKMFAPQTNTASQ